MDAIPIWAVFVGTSILMMIAMESGHRLGDFLFRRERGEKELPDSVITGAVLGLAAFMLAFTFGIVSDRNDAKRALVREDANAIRTAWQRSVFLPEPDRAEAADLLRRYVDLRVGFAEERNVDSENVRTALTENQRIQNRLWEMAVANARLDMNSDVAAMYIESLNEMIAIHASRVAIGIQARVAGGIWIALYGITLLGMVCVGYQTGIAGSKRPMARPIFVLVFVFVFTLIAALDRPESRFMRIKQQPLIDLRESMGERSGAGAR